MNEEGMKRGVNYSNDGNGTGVRCIEHKVSKFDTLAGIAIKYGVEVEDIKRMNCLMTDIQMFAHEQMKIPIPGRHPPSENLPNGSSHKNRIKDPSYRGHSHIDLLESFQSLKLKSTRPKVMSPAMANLQCYYGLSSSETTVSRTNIKPDLQQQPYGNHRKTRSVNGYTSENEEITEDSIVADGEDNSILDKCYCENSVRRRQKADVEPSYNTSGVLSRRKDEGYSSGKTGKNPAPKKFGIQADLDLGRANSTPIGDLFSGNGHFSVKKSSSTSNLQESDNSSLWPTSKWMFNTNAMNRPLLDGMPKPIVPRTRWKSAVD